MLSKEEIENKEELLKKISKEQYGDKWFIEKSILNYEKQKEKTYTFFRDDEQAELLRKYNFCQRTDSTNMSLRRFTNNGEIEGWMSESLAEEFGLTQIDLNEFIWKFVQPIIKENLQLKSDKQKLIEKLKERRKQNNDRYGQSIDNDDFPEMYEYSGQVKEDDYILSIVKGEKIV